MSLSILKNIPLIVVLTIGATLPLASHAIYASDTAFESAMDKHHSALLAQKTLADMYYFGHLERDYKKAAFWYLKAAEQGDIKSQFAIGYMHHYGQGVQVNHKQAHDWYLEVVSNSKSESDLVTKAIAQQYLGYMYTEGQGVVKDTEKAAQWYREAAESGQ